MRFPTIARLLVGATVLSLVVAACGGGDDPTVSAPTAGPAPTLVPAQTAMPTLTAAPARTTAPAATVRPAATARPAPTAMPAPTARPTPTSPPAPTGELRVAEASLQDYVLLPGFAAGVSRRYLDALYDNLVGIGLDGQLNGDNGFATSFTSTADGKTWTFKTKSGVFFHDGEEATANDFKFTLDWLISDESSAAVKGDLQALLAFVETPNDSTVDVFLNSSDIFFPVKFLTKTAGGGTGYLYPEKFVTAQGGRAANRSPVGSGPFRFEEVNIGQNIVMEATSDPHWHYGAPRYQTLEFREIPEAQSRIALLKSGGVEVVEIERGNVLDLRSDGFDIAAKDSSNVGQINYHEQWKTYDGVPNPLGNTKVRQALSLAVDKQLIVDEFMLGQATATHDYWFSIEDPDFRPTPIPAQDLDRARELLAEAGYPDGFELDVRTFPGANIPESAEIMEAIAVWWEAIGIDVNRAPIDFSGAISAWRTQGFSRPTAMGVAFGGNRPLGVQHIGVFTKSSSFRVTEDPKIDTLATEFRAVTTIEDNIRLGQEVQEALIEEQYQLMLFYAGVVYAAIPGIGGDAWDLGKGVFSININHLATGIAE